MEQRLGALRIPLGPGATTIDLLAALRGARLEILYRRVTSSGEITSISLELVALL